MSKRVLRSLAGLLAVCAAAALLGILGSGTLAALGDVETSAGNAFTAGTLDLQVNGVDNPGQVITCGPLQPGKSGQQGITLRNAGNLDGVLSITIGSVNESPAGDALRMSMEYAGKTLSSGERLSDWSGKSFGEFGLPAGDSRELVISWHLPEGDESNAARKESASFDIRFDLRLP